VAVETEDHYRTIVRELTEGSVVPLLGAGVNLCGRPKNATFQRGGGYLPSGWELTKHLATHFNYPQAKRNGRFTRPLDLVRVSQYVVAQDGAAPLYRELRTLFNADFPTTAVHGFFARFPARMRARGSDRRQLILTTNYDDALERAFKAQNEPVHVVWYIADPAEERGKFWHRPPEGEPRRISKPNRYPLPIEEETVILKIHGAVDRAKADRDSFVITEDHYIDYLAKTDISALLPSDILLHLKRSAFLFLGYSMADWNLRVILHRIWGDQQLTYHSWAIRKDADKVERALWQARDVQVYDLPLEAYMEELERRIEAP
jgi:SIR2-like domain